MKKAAKTVNKAYMKKYYNEEPCKVQRAQEDQAEPIFSSRATPPADRRGGTRPVTEILVIFLKRGKRAVRTLPNWPREYSAGTERCQWWRHGLGS